ncbi:MAG: N-formylglutamate deformylase [Halofilum sp. (in: g-proteobacteria)]|nr:N-formylglutamate deformylase [Halofilum sp. (in: g-proteobacteria)]
MQAVDVTRRGGPLILSMPHSGTHVPDELLRRLTPLGRRLPDTDWHIDRLYDFAGDLDATVVRANASRYVVDVNREPNDRSLYPGQATTGLCPTITFDGDPLYAGGDEPDADEIAARRRDWYAPYHGALAAEIERVRALHDRVLLYDCHSIRSHVPRLFEGQLPVFNVGTNDGSSCDPALEAAVVDICATRDDFNHVVNGRFRGGWITRHYGRPVEHVHALQMELAQRAYMQEQPPWEFDAPRAEALRPVLRAVLETMCAWVHDARAGADHDVG